MESAVALPINNSAGILTCVWLLNGPLDHPLACKWTLGQQAGNKSEAGAAARLQNN